MTENVRTFEVQIKGANSVKELKQEISDLRDKLVQLDNTSDEYSKTVEDLISDEKKLREVMSAGKSAVTGATGSYNALVNEMGALKKVWKEVTSEAERNKIGARIGEINDELKRMDSTIGNNQRKVGSYEEAIKKALLTPQQELRKLRTELAQMEQGTEEYNRTFTRMTQITHDLTEQQEMLRWSSGDLGDILSNLTGIAQGVAGGMSAINAITGLIAGGNEDVEKAMLTTQRWMQLIQGLGALEELGDRIKGLWQGLKNYSNAQNVAVSTISDFADTAEATGGSVEDTSQAISRQGAIMQQATATVKEFADGMKLLTQEEIKELEILNQQAVVYNENIVARQQAISDLDHLLDLEMISQDEYDKSLSIHKQILSVDKKSLDETEKSIKALKEKTEANKVLGKSVDNNTKSLSLYGKMLKWIETKSKDATQSTNILYKGLGKVGLSIVNLGNIIKTVVSSTIIGFLIVGLGAAVSWLWKYIDGSAKAEKRTKQLKDATEALNKVLDEKEKAWEREEKLLNAQGKSYEEIYKARKKNLEQQLKEVEVTLMAQRAMANEIGERKLKKDKYEEFRNELAELEKQYTELQTAISDLDWDKYVKGIEDATKQEKERQKIYQEGKKKAEELYKTTLEYFKDEKTKLKEKYDAEKALLEKYGLSTIELTKKYEKEKTAIILNESNARYQKMREYTSREINMLGEEDALVAKLENAEFMAEDFNEYAPNFDKSGGSIPTEVIQELNSIYGLSMANITDFEQQMRLANKAVEDAKKALKEFRSAKIMDNLSKDLEKLGNTSQSELEKFNLLWQKYASESTYGFYTGLSPEEKKLEMEERYKLQEKYLLDELKLYQDVVKQENLTDEDRAEVQSYINSILISQQNLATQKTIENNNLIIDSYQLVADSITNIANSMADVLGSVSSLIMENAESQLAAGEITQKEYEKQFENAKAVQIAQATINTISGALGAFMGITRDTGGWGIAVAIAQATAVLTAGLLQIQQIKNTKPNGSSSNVKFAEVTPTATSDYKPEITQNATGSQETQDLANALAQNPIKAYVVESDISRVQRQTNQREKETTF
jgi:hypothetical protein